MSPSDLNPVGFVSRSKPQEINDRAVPKLYHYHPLGENEIRVFELFAGADDDKLMVNVSHVQLEDPLGSECTALSYTWGNPNDIQPIYCSNGNGVIVVTKECYSALRRLRLHTRSQTLWVDAICINQNDISERNHQVTLMSKIYHFSTKVMIYLGPSTNDSELALKYLYPSQPRRMANMSPREMDALRALFSRPWFSRVWVIQEARNAKRAEVMYGDKSYPWNGFVMRPWGQHFFSESFLGPIPYVLIPPKTYWVGRDYAYNEDILSPNCLYQHLVRARRCLASDPRDKVFALLPLFKDADSALAKANLLPNYSKSVEAVMLDVAKYLVEDVNWALLYSVESGSTLDIPSWCPDWSMTPATPLLYSFDRMPYRSEFSPTEDNVPVLLPDNILQVRGVSYDTITKVGQACDINDPNWVEVVFIDWRSFMLRTLSDNVSIPQDKSQQESIDRPQDQLNEKEHEIMRDMFTFINDVPHDSGISSSDEFRFKAMNAYRQGLEIGHREPHDRIRNRCQGQKIFLTLKGRFGLGSTHMKVGDIVLCLKDATVPFLIRSKEDGRFSFVSKCEIQGFNSREYMEGILGDSLEQFLLV